VSWQTTFNGNWKTSLASSLTAMTVKLGPVTNVEFDGNTTAVIVCSNRRTWDPTMSPTANRTYDVVLYLGVIVQGMDGAESVDDLWDALDTVEDAVWTLLAPGTFRATNRIDTVVSVTSTVATATTGAVEITLRVRRS
jgi:hypothetical protein